MEAIEESLCEARGEVESDEDSLIGGGSNGTEIYRTVAIYTPATQGDHDEVAA